MKFSAAILLAIFGTAIAIPTRTSPYISPPKHN